MAPLGTYLLLMFAGLIASKRTGALWIEPKQATYTVKEGNEIGAKILNVTVGPGTTNDNLKIRIDDRKNCLNYTNLEATVPCNANCSFSIVANTVLDRESTSQCGFMVIIIYYGFKEPLTDRHIYRFIVADINDNPPQFVNLPYKLSINESFPINTVLPGLNIRATDKDEGTNGQITYILTPAGQNTAGINGTMTINSITGAITLNKHLDYEIRNFYQYTVMAIDAGNPPLNSTESVWIQIIDVQDTAPVFINPSFIKHIREDAIIGTTVMSVTAEDGDRGIPNGILYTIDDNRCNRFTINQTSGVISVKRDLNLTETSLKHLYGVCPITVIAKEDDVISNSTEQDITIFIDDINNHGPVFSNPAYSANISEATAIDNPVIMNQSIQISDDDLKVENNNFSLSLQHMNGSAFSALSVWPNASVARAGVILLVKDKKQLDYEKRDHIKFKIVARGAQGKYKSSATVALTILPFNEYRPKFARNYTVCLPENTTKGHYVTNVSATDDDKGIHGNITYSLYGSNGLFLIDKFTGVVTLGKAELDYENVKSYHLTVDATDGGNKKDTTSLYVCINDTNDEAPEFTSSKYEETVKENEEIKIAVQAKDKDERGSPNSQVSYTIVSVSQNLRQNFTINSSGLIHAKSIDYEKLTSDQIILEVEASDQGNPQQHTRTNVTINIQDVNDNPPRFTYPVYKFRVPENVTTGHYIGNVSATDADRQNINKRLTYLLVNETDKFSINSGTGSIFILGKLDREKNDHYLLQVEVIDGGTPPLNSTAILNITVTDVNDELPVLLDSSATIVVAENITINSTIVKINATDEDLNAKLVYGIYSQKIEVDGKGMYVNKISTDYFGINKTTGEIFLKESLDREVAELISLGIEVNDTNADGQPQVSKGQQKIEILDVNDNPPKFLNAFIELSLSENLPVNTTLTRVSATDADKNDNVTYSFQRKYTQFKINKTTGEIILVKNLDRETNANISLFVLAKDTKPERKTSTATISLNILDYNDNSPIFVGLYNKTYNVSENASNGTEILTATATDADTGINADIRYSLFYEDNDQMLPISIDHTTGKVFVSGKLNREATSLYKIEIKAKDMAGLYSENARTGSTWIKINVTDINDCAPKFLSPSYYANVQENTPPDQSVIQVQATDQDVGENSRLSFKLEGDEATFFKIGQSNGIISVNLSLTDKVGVKRFLVVATDNGMPSKNNTANVTINITDTNNHRPEFARDQEVIYISEAVCPGSFIFNVSATDKDFYPPNNQMTYELKIEKHYEPDLKKEKNYKYFNLDKNTGRLILARKLDREKHKIHELTITATDKGSPPLESIPFQLIINVTNVDDEPPVFRSQDYKNLEKTLFVQEGKPPLFVGEIKAYDSYPDSKPCYKIVDKTNEQYFKVDSVNGYGNITTLKELDYETKKIYNFMLETFDCNNKVYNICGSSVTPTENKLSIIVNVTDINDHPPRFINKSMHMAIQPDLKLKTVIANLTSMITDGDDYAENKKNFFKILKFTPYGDVSLQAKPFVVEKKLLKTNQLFSAAQIGYITLLIKAYDENGKSDTAELKVYIIANGNKIKITFMKTVEQTEKNKETFSRQLGNILGKNITIVPGKIEPLQRADGTYEKRKTVMFIYGFQNEKIMSAENLQKLIDWNTKKLSEIQNKYSIISIMSVEQKSATSSNSSKNQVILSAVIALLGITLLVVLFLFYGSIQRFKRKLKAANIDIHNNKEDFQKWIVPGSNVHALGESNPIYNKDINPVMNLPDKVSLNSLDMNEVGDSAVFVDPFDEQEVALDFIDDPPNETSTTSKDYSKTFLDNVIKEREAEMNKKNQNSGSMSGSTNMALNVTNLETTDV